MRRCTSCGYELNLIGVSACKKWRLAVRLAVYLMRRAHLALEREVGSMLTKSHRIPLSREVTRMEKHALS